MVMNLRRARGICYASFYNRAYRKYEKKQLRPHMRHLISQFERYPYNGTACSIVAHMTTLLNTQTIAKAENDCDLVVNLRRARRLVEVCRQRAARVIQRHMVIFLWRPCSILVKRMIRSDLCRITSRRADGFDTFLRPLSSLSVVSTQYR